MNPKTPPGVSKTVRRLCGCSGPASRAAGNLDPGRPQLPSEDEKTPVFPLETAGSRSTDLSSGGQLGKEVPGLPTLLCYHHCSSQYASK